MSAGNARIKKDSNCRQGSGVLKNVSGGREEERTFQVEGVTKEKQCR